MEEKDMRLIDRVLRMKIKIFGIEMECIDMMFGIIILTFGLVARLYLFDVVSGDYADAFADWMREIRQAHDQTPDNVWRLTDELLEYPQMYFMSEANKAPVTDKAIVSAGKLLVYAADYDTQDESLQGILESNPNLTGYDVVSKKDMWTLYEFH